MPCPGRPGLPPPDCRRRRGADARSPAHRCGSSQARPNFLPWFFLIAHLFYGRSGRAQQDVTIESIRAAASGIRSSARHCCGRFGRGAGDRRVPRRPGRPSRHNPAPAALPSPVASPQPTTGRVAHRDRARPKLHRRPAGHRRIQRDADAAPAAARSTSLHQYLLEQGEVAYIVQTAIYPDDINVSNPRINLQGGLDNLAKGMEGGKWAQRRLGDAPGPDGRRRRRG